MGQVATAIGAHLLTRPLERLTLQIGEHQFHRTSGAAEDNGLDVVSPQVLCQADAFLQQAAPQAQLPIHNRRVVDQEMPGGVGGAVVVHQRDWFLDQAAGQLQRIADGGRGENELRGTAVEPGHPLQAAHDVGHVGAEHAPVGMHLVYHHKAQAAEEVSPGSVMRQYAGMQHIGIADDHPGPATNGRSGGGRRVAVVSGNRNCLLLGTL